MVSWKSWPRKKSEKKEKSRFAEDRPDYLAFVAFPHRATVRNVIVSLESLLFQLDEKQLDRGVTDIKFDETKKLLTIELQKGESG